MQHIQTREEIGYRGELYPLDLVIDIYGNKEKGITFGKATIYMGEDRYAIDKKPVEREAIVHCHAPDPYDFGIGASYCTLKLKCKLGLIKNDKGQVVMAYIQANGIWSPQEGGTSEPIDSYTIIEEGW